MEASRVPEAGDGALAVQSHRGEYKVEFGALAFRTLEDTDPATAHFIVDSRVAELYPAELAPAEKVRPLVLIPASEDAKSLERCAGYVTRLLDSGVRRNHRLVAIGGGVIQDIVAFLASTLLRGMDWEFFPTTLLAQADSCIGSKSSINVGRYKNVVGTFWPPKRIYVSSNVRKTLSDVDIRSGIGEMLKVHAIDGPDSFDRIAESLDALRRDESVMQQFIRRSLEIKRRLIELDEFDRGPRLVMNYGHSFGHAIEAATGFAIPHGIAITIGMDMANFVSSRRGRLPSSRFDEMHGPLMRNAAQFRGAPIPPDGFFNALSKDKKNVGDRITLILPDSGARIELAEVANDHSFRDQCLEYLGSVRYR